MGRISEIKSRCGKATNGPWRPVVEHWHRNKVMTEITVIAQMVGDSPECDATTEFIAHSRSDIPYLFDLVERAREIITITRAVAIYDRNSELQYKAEQWLSEVQGETKAE